LIWDPNPDPHPIHKTNPNPHRNTTELVLRQKNTYRSGINHGNKA